MRHDTSGDKLIEALLEKYGRSREAILGEHGLLADLKKRVVEKALAGELTHLLAYCAGEKPKGAGKPSQWLHWEKGSERRGRNWF